jgi:3-dehydroquinate dehydratase type I
MMNVNVCVVITAGNLKEAKRQLKKAKKFTKWVEIRADYISGLTSRDIAELNLLCEGFNTIFTLRDIKFGGKFDRGSKERTGLFNFALTQNFEFFDIDFEAFIEVAEYIKLSKKQFILSYHNFNETPDLESLSEIFLKISGYKPSIIKIATMVLKKTDINNLMSLLLKFSDTKRIIVGMGEKGVLSRIIFPFFGSFLTFASLDKAGSAPGQLEVSQIKKIYSTISNSINNF